MGVRDLPDHGVTGLDLGELEVSLRRERHCSVGLQLSSRLIFPVDFSLLDASPLCSEDQQL